MDNTSLPPSFGSMDQEEQIWEDEVTNASLSAFPVNCTFRASMLHQRQFHSHSGFELYLCLSGTGSYIAGGKLYDLGPGAWIAVRPNALHISRPAADVPFHRFVLAVEESYLNSLGEQDEAISVWMRPWLPEPGQHAKYRRLDAQRLLIVQETLTQLELEQKLRSPGYPLMVKSLLLKLFADLNRHTGRAEPLPPSDASRDHKQLIERILAYLMEHYREPLPADRLCRHFNLSRSHLFLLFKRHTGATLNGFVVTYRLNKAKELLQTTRLPIIEIAAASGFQDVSHFCHTFKREVGRTPTQYRATHGLL
ncbi:AraC-like ligand binding domain-containing protein [Paenibacillus sp. UNCCL117]|uniref:AraC family transcriptional regulator n=1 Tax=unclassified Paenibacillus TaxID=185978 RepID=UPI0008846198|nr:MULTISPECIES: AraC family transcriptional regulator [unclassified Paenibacillus]SDC63093.1 AraC-like ligand binding domain-containing protein [Paenibacillus sp. cl123]SFW22207.1 AraC-like ligand binding domain-containing protein [Paenibacillus sp. UNCCL117]